MEEKQLTLGSLFDGSGGFPLGGLLCGIKPEWASEVEPFPIRVTTKRLPMVQHLGNVCKINGAEIAPVDIITSGSPCQDMSLAGKREGLDGKRSSLFYEAIRIIKEMRCATDGKYPRYFVWENVPGAFSSNKGEDFKAVLEAIVSVSTDAAVPKPAKWTGAGCIMGDGFSVAWRVLDAAGWGVPQRRKRIYLVADFAGRCAGKILFESESVSGYPSPCFHAWQSAAGAAAKGTGKTGTICLNDQGGERMDVSEDRTGTLRAQSNHPPIVFENHSQDTRYTELDEVAPTVLSTYGTGGNNQPFVLESYDVRLTSEGTLNARANVYKTETARTIDTSGNSPDSNQGGIAVIEGNGARPSHHGDGYKMDGPMYTLNLVEKHAVAYGLDRAAYNQGKNAKFGFAVEEDVEPPILARGAGAVAHPVYSMCKGSFFTKVYEEQAGTLVATDYKDPPIVNDEPDYIIRRLTPTECARLQGFPDGWCANLEMKLPSKEELDFWEGVFETHRLIMGTSQKPKSRKQIFKWLQNPHSDAAEYKMWGNGVALPNVCFVLAGIRHFTEN